MVYDQWFYKAFIKQAMFPHLSGQTERLVGCILYWNKGKKAILPIMFPILYVIHICLVFHIIFTLAFYT